MKNLFLITALIFSSGASGQNLVEKTAKDCNAGNVMACFNLGNAYYFGEKVEKDLVKAKQLYEKSCNADFSVGCAGLALMYYSGKGVKEDKETANKLFKKACDLGEKNSCMVIEGEAESSFKQGVMAYEEEKFGEAIKLFEKACNADLADACFNLGIIYYEGKGVAKDIAKTIQLFEKSCNGGLVEACSNLGVMYGALEKDEETAKKFFQKACDLGDKTSCGAVETIILNEKKEK